MSCGRRPAPRNVVKWDVGRPAPRPPRTFAVMRSPADCVVGGGVPDAPRRGQDPSLRCKGYRGGNGEAAGRACPAPTDCRKRLVDERGEGGRQPGPFSRAEVAREWAATHSPSESPSPLTRPAPFDKGPPPPPCGGSGALGGAQRAPPVCFANTLVRLFAPQGQTLLAPQFRCAQLWPRARNPATPDSKVEEGPQALSANSNTAFA